MIQPIHRFRALFSAVLKAACVAGAPLWARPSPSNPGPDYAF